jgi:outer membrane protein TolC
MLKKIFSLTLVISLQLSIHPSERSLGQEKLSLEDAIKIALDNNYSISIARNQKEITENNFSLGNAGFLPDLSANASYSDRTTNTKQEYIDGRVIDRKDAGSTNFSSAVALNWTIFDGFNMFASYSLLKELSEIGKLHFKQTVENNVAKIISTYFEIVQEEHVIKVIQSNIQLSEERVSIAESKREVGSGSKFDLLRAQADLNEDKAALLREELKFVQAKITLNQLLGRNIEIDFSVTDTINIHPDLLFEDLITGLEDLNSEILIALKNKNISETEILLFKSEWYPQISLNAGYDYSDATTEAGFIQTNRNQGYYYGIRASLSLFNGLNTKRKIENAKIFYLNSELSYNDIVQNVKAELLNSYKSYSNSIDRVKLETDNLKVAEENVDIALERLRLGNITPLEFRETQRQLFDAESRLLSAKYDAKIAETNLLRISGRLVSTVE